MTCCTAIRKTGSSTAITTGLYEKVFCARGDMENRIKECQGDVFADRTSAATMLANQLRLWFASMAYVLFSALCRIVLAHTQFAEATCGTIRLMLLKIDALVTISVRASASPWPRPAPTLRNGASPQQARSGPRLSRLTGVPFAPIKVAQMPRPTPHRAFGYRLAQPPHQPIGAGVQEQPELVVSGPSSPASTRAMTRSTRLQFAAASKNFLKRTLPSLEAASKRALELASWVSVWRRKAAFGATPRS
jgi:hypothetical protein